MENNTIPTETVLLQEPQKKTEKKAIKINLKTAIIIGVIAAVGILAYVYKGLFIAATVDGSPISRLTIIQRLEKASGKSLLDSLIAEKLIQNEAAAKNIVVTDDEVNSQIKTIQGQIIAQGSTLDEALKARGMTMKDLEKQIALQIKIEKLVADKVNVTDEEVAQYIKDNGITVPAGQEEATNAQVKNELRNQKLSQEADALVATLKLQAKINYFVNY